MTARRPSKITSDVPAHASRDEEHFRRLLNGLSEDRWENEPAGSLQDAANAQILRVQRELPDEKADPKIHPTFTDYGPESAANVFRQARPNHQSTSQSPPARLHGETRSRNQKIPRSIQGKFCYDFPVGRSAALGEGPELLTCPAPDSQRLTESPGASIEARKSWCRTNEDLLESEENKAPLRRKGPKRARRTSTWQGTTNEENATHPQNAPHGAALLRSMRLRRAAGVTRVQRNEGTLPAWDDENFRASPQTLGTHSWFNMSNRPASADLGLNSMQDWPQETREEAELERDDDLDRVNDLQQSMEAEALSADDHWRPMQVPQAQRSRTSVGCRSSRLSSPPGITQASRRQTLQDSFVRTLVEPGEDEYVGSDGESTSSREDYSLTDMHPNVIRFGARNISTSVECHNNEGIKPPFSQFLTIRASMTKQQHTSLQPSVSTALHYDVSAPYRTSFKYEEIAPAKALKDAVQRGGAMSPLRPLAKKRDGIEAPITKKRSASRNSPIFSMSKCEPEPLPISHQEPPGAHAKSTTCGWPDLPTEIYFEIARYLSREDALNLRLVCRTFSIAIMGAVFGSVVVPFGRAMYDINLTTWDRNPPPGSMFEKYGLAIRKFGMTFEADPDLIAKAQTKTISNQQSSWWGSYTWPTPVYPRFGHLHILENLADNVSLLKSAMAHLGKTHELGLSIDSGHGWLNGPDMSDMALFDARCGKGKRVFGKNLAAEDKQKQATRTKLFECAQARTLQECTDILRIYNRHFTSGDLAFMRSVAVRNLDSFRSNTIQPDYDAAAHVGGAIPTADATGNVAQHPNGGQPPAGGPHQPQNVVMNAGLYNPGVVNPLQQTMAGQNQHNPPINTNQPQHGIAAFHPGIFNHGMFQAAPAQPNAAVSNVPPQAHSDQRQIANNLNRTQASFMKVPKQEHLTQPQFPIIFNGYNLSAEIGGWCHLIQSKTASPKLFPLQPGALTEAQAQWLMETVWAQRAFLSAYTTSILANKACFAQVHSLHVAKISSGLLSSLEQKELWQGLPGLTNLTVLVSPDWRVEHITGDQTFNSNMPISPFDASLQLSNFLKTYIAPLEKLSNLTLGFVGGGENARGIMARNQHVLPAPISSNPRMWLSDHVTEPDPCTIITFNHIKHLTLQNAWLSPLMLEAFMIKSQDTSLRTLALDSISLTSNHSQRLVAPLATASKPLDPIHPPSMWLHESLPTTHCWAATIDHVTPGATFLDRKYDAGMIVDPYIHPRPPPSFRGFASRLIFRSCGYVRISGVSIQELNQNDLVYPNSDPMDAGLKARAAALAEKGVMLDDKNPSTGANWPLLGKLTQCIHPVEKRVLEQAWGMRFGWDDDLERWAAVEDGCFEGGTGRFGGVIVGEGGKGIDADVR